MRNFRLASSLGTVGIAVVLAIVLPGPLASQAQAPAGAAAHIQTYYQELMPTIQQAGRLSVRERDKRFAPAITTFFDLATMTRLAVGPPLEKLLAGTTGGSPGRLHTVHDRRVCEPDKRLFRGKLRCRSADKSGLAWWRRNR